MKIKLVLLAAALALPASAQTLLFDFGRSTNNTTGAPDAYNNLNITTTLVTTLNTSFTNLVATNGNATSIGLTLNKAGTGQIGAAAVGADWTGAKPAAISGFASTALNDGWVVNGGGTYTLTFTNLNPSLAYNLTLYSARGNNSTDGTFTLTGGTVGSGGNGSTTTFNGFENSTHVVQWTNLIPTVGGSIVFTVTDTALNQTFTGGTPANTNFALNFGVLTAVPEPSSYAAIAGALMIGIAAYRRRRA